jgi:hypothetical protein
VNADPVGAASEASSTGGPVDAGDAETQSQSAAASDAQGQPSEEELRAAYEAEMSRITSADMILQATVSLLNIGGYRLGLSPGGEEPAGGARDLEQVRDAIDGARALMPILERRQPGELRPLRDALSQLQMAYAREAGSGAPAQPPVAPPPAAAGQEPPATAGKPGGPGPAESSGRLWVPGR